MARDGLINWRLANARAVSAEFQAMIRQIQRPEEAFDEMLDVIAARQVEWFRDEGASGGNKPWAARRGKYADYMRRRYPDRKILHGPDKGSHKGGELRKQLTQRPFGRERISARGWSMGTDLPYSIIHQQGDGFPVRRPLRPMDQATLSEFSTILSRHIRYVRSGSTGKRFGSFKSAGSMLSKGRKGRK